MYKGQEIFLFKHDHYDHDVHRHSLQQLFDTVGFCHSVVIFCFMSSMVYRMQ